MHKTMDLYRDRIQAGQVDPVRRWDGRNSAVLLDCNDDRVPLCVLGMEAFALGGQPAVFESGDREQLIVPVTGRWQVRISVNGTDVEFAGDRGQGPFDAWPGGCSATTIYVPRHARVVLDGKGEAVAFSAPAFADRPPACVVCDEHRPLVSRGSTVWRRDVVTLATPVDVTSNLILGETYSPPGLWSGTPLHVHDAPVPVDAQSDHEEIYYHLADVRDGAGPWGAYGGQFLFDDKGLDRAYVVGHRTAFAIPGAAHPVVAGPNCAMMYIWALASESSHPLAMMDVPEFAWLKRVGGIVDALQTDRGPTRISESRFAELTAKAELNPSQARVLRFHLEQLGFTVKGPSA
ncbi:MAG: 5-deoxy-glucuronate isomerase [Phycisphaerae bacterium]|nr:5-deoxy-glucuronate isomerase [Phycisphaerae bacterium]